MWKWIKKNAGKIIGGAIGGPIGLILGAAVDELIKYIEEQKSFILPTHLQQEVDDFAENHVKPIVITYLQSMGTAASLNDLVKTIHVNKLNTAIKHLSTLKAYFEFVNKQATNGEQVLVNEEIILGLSQSIQIITQTYAKATEGIANTHEPATISFTPSSFETIGEFQLNWQGATVKGNYLGYKEPQAGTINPGGSTGSGTTKPGGSTGGTTKPGSSTGSGTTKPGGSTGGTTKPGSSTGSGTTIQIPPPTGGNPVTTLPPTNTGGTFGGSGVTPGTVIATGPANTNLPAQTKKANNNQKYLIIGGAVLLAAFLFNRK